MQGWAAIARNGTTRKRKGKRWIVYKRAVYQKSKHRKYQVTLDFKSFRSKVKAKHSSGKEFKSLGVKGKNLLTCRYRHPYNM